MKHFLRCYIPAGITLSQEGSGDRYSYKATNAKGQTLTITDGTQSSGRNYSSIYTFNGSDGSEYVVLEDFGGGKAALNIGNYPDKGATYNRTTVLQKGVSTLNVKQVRYKELSLGNSEVGK